MWKKEDGPDPTPGAPQTERPPARTEPARSTPATGERATIGRSITIKGEVSGDEDLLIQGRVDGSVNLKQQSVTVGKEGRVKADITGRVVTIEGEVVGNLKAEEQVILRSSAKVQGDITAPRVVLEDGGTFRGGIDMGDPVAQSKLTTDTSFTVPKQASSGPQGQAELLKASDSQTDATAAVGKAKN
jgi:cytoskeletal protein CcmA (bactofilin family)